MSLSKFQKKIVNSLKPDFFYDLSWFIDTFCKIENTLGNSDWDDVPVTSSCFVPEDNEAFLKNIAEFIALWEYLRREGLISEINTKKNVSKLILRKKDDGNGGPFHYYSKLISNYKDKSFFPTPSLFDFKKNKFLTSEEFKYRRSQRITILIAIIIPIIISVFTVILENILYPNKSKPVIIVDSKKDSVNYSIHQDSLKFNFEK